MMKKILWLLVFVLFVQIVHATHLVTTQFTGTSLVILDGTNISGTLEDTFIDDENKFIIQEAIVMGTDVFLVMIDFTGLPATDNLQELRLLVNATAVFNEPDDFVEFAMYDFFCADDFYLFPEILNGTDVFLNMTIDTFPNCYYSGGLVRTAFGDIDNVVTPIKDNMSLDYFILEVVDLQNDYNIDLTSPINNTSTTENIITFEFDIDSNGSCNLTANNIVRNVSNLTAGSNYFIENLSINTYDWKIGCEDEVSETWRLNIVAVVPPPREDEYILGSCPVDTLPRAMLFIFFIMLSFVIMGMGYAMKNGLIGTIGSFMLIGTGVYLWFCLGFVSLIMMSLGVIMMSMFVFKGVKAFR